MSIHHENTANKLRPRAFSELAGQEFVVTTICSSIAQDKIAPAYLFSGPRGVGKTSAARLVALSINRPEGTSVDNLSYEGSEDIRLGKSLDVIEIDGASYTSVDNIRNIREEIMYAPVHFRYKVYIIDEVHMLSHSAFNALLKTIEEPPSYAIFIFATTELHKVPATIKSRCQQFSFRLISSSEITNQLAKICQTEQIFVEQNALQWIAKEAQGSFRDAYTLFDQIKAFSNNNITIESIKSHLGLAGLDVLNEIFGFCVEGKRSEVLQSIDRLLSQGVAMEQFVIESAEYIRNILLIKSNIISSELLGYAPELFEERVYKNFTAEQLERALSLLLECYRNLRYSLNTRFEVELVFAQLSDLIKYVTPQELVTQLDRMSNEQENSIIKEPISIERSVQASSEDEVSDVSSNIENRFEHTSTQAEQSAENPVRLEEHTRNFNMLWSDIIAGIMTKNASLALALDSGIPRQEGKKLVVEFSDEYGYNKFILVQEKIAQYGSKLAGDEIFVEAKLLEQSSALHISSKEEINIHDSSFSEDISSKEEKNITETAQNVLDVFGGVVE